MKQKLVIKVTANDQKSRTKVLKIAVGFSGVDSVELQGQDKSQLAVVGDGFDAVELVTLLRKKVGCAEIASVAPVGGEKKVEATPPQQQQPMGGYYPYGGGVPPYYTYEANYSDYRDPSCSIM